MIIGTREVVFMLASASLLVAFGACEADARSRAEPRPSTVGEGAPIAAQRAVAPSSATAAPQALADGERPERRFGGAATVTGEPLPVERLLARPDDYVGKQVKCAGRVARVCQNAGCWLELQAEQGGEGLRVPMAGHAFFIPKDAVGQLAIVEGELIRQPLDAHSREHYAGEGMKAMGPLSLEASSVVLQ